MSTQTKSRLAALLVAVAGAMIAQFVPAEAQPHFVGVVGAVAGWLGLRQPGQ